MNFFIFINVPVFLIAFLVLPQPNGAQWSDESIPLGMAWSERPTSRKLSELHLRFLKSVEEMIKNLNVTTIDWANRFTTTPYIRTTRFSNETTTTVLTTTTPRRRRSRTLPTTIRRREQGLDLIELCRRTRTLPPFNFSKRSFGDTLSMTPQASPTETSLTETSPTETSIKLTTSTSTTTTFKANLQQTIKKTYAWFRKMTGKSLLRPNDTKTRTGGIMNFIRPKVRVTKFRDSLVVADISESAKSSETAEEQEHRVKAPVSSDIDDDTDSDLEDDFISDSKFGGRGTYSTADFFNIDPFHVRKRRCVPFDLEKPININEELLFRDDAFVFPWLSSREVKIVYGSTRLGHKYGVVFPWEVNEVDDGGVTRSVEIANPEWRRWYEMKKYESLEKRMEKNGSTIFRFITLPTFEFTFTKRYYRTKRSVAPRYWSTVARTRAKAIETDKSSSESLISEDSENRESGDSESLTPLTTRTENSQQESSVDNDTWSTFPWIRGESQTKENEIHKDISSENSTIKTAMSENLTSESLSKEKQTQPFQFFAEVTEGSTINKLRKTVPKDDIMWESMDIESLEEMDQEISDNQKRHGKERKQKSLKAQNASDESSLKKSAYEIVKAGAHTWMIRPWMRQRTRMSKKKMQQTEPESSIWESENKEPWTVPPWALKYSSEEELNQTYDEMVSKSSSFKRLTTAFHVQGIESWKRNKSRTRIYETEEEAIQRGAKTESRTWASRNWEYRTWRSRTWGERKWDGNTWASRTWGSRSWGNKVDGNTWPSRTWEYRSWPRQTWTSRSWGNKVDGNTNPSRTWEYRSWPKHTWTYSRSWGNKVDGNTNPSRTWEYRSWPKHTWASRSWGNKVDGNTNPSRTWEYRSWPKHTWTYGRSWGNKVDGNTNPSRTWEYRSWPKHTWASRSWGNKVDGNTWSSRAWEHRSWASKTWASRSWGERKWDFNTWPSRTNPGQTWASRPWGGRTSSDRTWSRRTWSKKAYENVNSEFEDNGGRFKRQLDENDYAGSSSSEKNGTQKKTLGEDRKNDSPIAPAPPPPLKLHPRFQKKSHGQESTRNPPPSKKPAPAVRSTPAPSKKNSSDEEDSWHLGQNRFVKVREFRGKVMVDIREFYEKDGELLPGKKGIALSATQWKKFKDLVNEIDVKLSQK